MTEEEIQKIYEKYEVPENIIRHMKKVEEFATEIAKKFIEKGIKVDLQNVNMGAALHDVLKAKEGGEHEEKMAKILEKMGKEKIANIVRKHGFNSINKLKSWEEKIVFYADKRVDQDELVSLEERFKRAESRNKDLLKDPESEKKKEAIRELEKEILRIIH